ncbi:MAG TPA: transglycosylase SLT domain-containing protein, partial [Aquella sp.]|nr:transglycosylase SLT domain-containing protein [Aquella sp.]
VSIWTSIVVSGLLISNNVNAISDIANADKLYASGNIGALWQIYRRSPGNRSISYLYAKALLSKNNPDAALLFIQSNLSDYLRNDILHQLLTFYYTNKSYASYQRIYKLLPDNQKTTNEKCGMDTATGKTTVDAAYIVNNNPPIWCAVSLSSAYTKGEIDKEQRDWLLYNLVASDKSSAYNQVAPHLGLHTIYFALYANKPTHNLLSNDFLVISRITSIGHKNPDGAWEELKRSGVSSNATAFLSNYLAMKFAQKHNFKQAIHLYEKYGENLSDDEYEWLARSYLFSGSWKDLIKTIDDMPKDLRQKNVWLYWEAVAYASLKESDKAREYFKLIPSDYSYYYMLAASELGTPTIYYTRPSKTTTFDNSNEAKAARIGLSLYQEGKRNNSKHLQTIGSSEWNYAAKSAEDDNLLLAMSNLAKQYSYFDLSIYAANQMENRYLELSFPLPFLATFTQYSKIFGIDPTYTLAVSRQESRFNYQVTAFDGGVGLMQIMPQTALYIARKSGSINCYHKGPECNIKFGSWYLGSLNNKFGNLIYSTAAYNAGPSRPRKWQDALGNLDDRVQIELIPISITRDYVQKVLSNKAIYDSELAGVSKIDFAKYINNIGKHHYLNILDDDNTDAGKI